VATFLNDYAQECMTQIRHAYDELVDSLMFKYLVDYREVAPSKLPQIAPPAVPDVPSGGGSRLLMAGSKSAA
jgi:hypothetical protein